MGLKINQYNSVLQTIHLLVELQITKKKNTLLIN